MTRAYAEVIGDPIAHSKSPVIHQFWLEALGIDGAYRAVRVAPAELGAYFTARAGDKDWRGCNVTIPHKLAALDHVADPGGIRGTIGAVNAVFRGAEEVPTGTNTDAAGFYTPLAEVALAGRPVVVVGAGGAARAVMFALARMEVGRVTVLNRDVTKAAALLDHFELRGDALPLDGGPPPAALVVNASALGMTGQPPLALDLGAQPDDCVVYDLVYAPLETDLLVRARARGLATIDGLAMLIGQAAVAFELFFGAPPPRERDAALRELLSA